MIYLLLIGLIFFGLEITSPIKIEYPPARTPYPSYSRPTQSLLQRWLREMHNIEVYVLPYSKTNNHKMIGGTGYYEVVVDLAGTTWSDHSTYEEALELGLQEGLKLIKNEKF